MSVDEMIAKLGELDAVELDKLGQAIAHARDAASETTEERWRRGDEILDRLRQGLVSCGGKHLSANIDEALYGGER